MSRSKASRLIHQMKNLESYSDNQRGAKSLVEDLVGIDSCSKSWFIPDPREKGDWFAIYRNTPESKYRIFKINVSSMELEEKSIDYLSEVTRASGSNKIEELLGRK